MKITLWGDFACPFCYIGEHLLKTVIKNRDDAGDNPDNVELRAYELDPEAPIIPTETMEEHFCSSHGITHEQARGQMLRITRMAERAGLQCNLGGVQVCNTFDAHRLMKLAYDISDVQTVRSLNFALFHANFVENKRLSDHEELKAIAKSVGLDMNEVEAVLSSDRYGDAVRNDENEADNLNLEYVPYMRFSNGQLLQGVLTLGEIRDAIEK